MELFTANVQSGDLKKLSEILPTLTSSEKQKLASSDAGKRSVFLAASADDDLVEALLQAGFDANYVIDTGETALHQAVKADRAKSVQLLLGCDSCDPNAADAHKQTPLHRAGEFGYVACLDFLISHARVDIDAEDAWSRTALHWTSQKGMIEQTKTLLQRQAKMITTVTKETPLHWAVRGGHKDVVELLLTRHPDLSVYALNDRMESPMEIARTLGFGAIVQTLWEHAEAHDQAPPTLNTVLNESQVHDTGIRTMTMKPKGGVRKLTIKRKDI